MKLLLRDASKDAFSISLRTISHYLIDLGVRKGFFFFLIMYLQKEQIAPKLRNPDDNIKITRLKTNIANCLTGRQICECLEHFSN